MLYYFSGSDDGGKPRRSLVQGPDGNFYCAADGIEPPRSVAAASGKTKLKHFRRDSDYDRFLFSLF